MREIANFESHSTNNSVKPLDISTWMPSTMAQSLAWVMEHLPILNTNNTNYCCIPHVVHCSITVQLELPRRGKVPMDFILYTQALNNFESHARDVTNKFTRALCSIRKNHLISSLPDKRYGDHKEQSPVILFTVLGTS